MNSKPKVDSEKLLYKLILQFAIFTRGSNILLEPHLNILNQSLKAGASYQDLTPELLSLSKTLAHLSHVSRESKDKIESSDTYTQQQYFIKQINKLLLESNIPPKFQNQCALIRKKINSNLDEIKFRKVMDSALSLLLVIKEHAISEQRHIETFLSNIPSQIQSLEQYTLSASESNKLSIEHRDHLNNVISQQFDNIKTSSDAANELSSLQTTINQHLLELSDQFKKHKDTEDSRQHDTQKQLNLMSHKLQDMEIEAEELRNDLKIAHDQALRDTLTGLPNRLAFDERSIIEFNRWYRYQTPLTLLIWDIDHFKLINDNYGHKAGDKTLTLVAQLILQNCRDTDFIARFGGEEFVMILPNTNAEQALTLANNIRSIIADSGFNYNSEAITLTISAGISQFTSDDDFESVFERADQALYSSKEQGRNKCTILNKS